MTRLLIPVSVVQELRSVKVKFHMSETEQYESAIQSFKSSKMAPVNDILPSPHKFPEKLEISSVNCRQKGIVACELTSHPSMVKTCLKVHSYFISNVPH